MEREISLKLARQKEVICYWLEKAYEEIKYTDDIEEVKCTACMMIDSNMAGYFDVDKTGIFIYVIATDFKGGIQFSEAFFYILPEHRGSLRLVKRYIMAAEEIARNASCNSIKIGANIKYKDNTFIKLLRRWGYQDEALSKEL